MGSILRGRVESLSSELPQTLMKFDVSDGLLTPAAAEAFSYPVASACAAKRRRSGFAAAHEDIKADLDMISIAALPSSAFIRPESP